MHTLFVYPEFPKTFWSYEKILELVNRKVLLPPLGLVTVAALLPQEWEMKLVDRNVREVTDEEWNWAELVIISGMIVQKDDMAVQISKAKQRGLPVAVGGPFASSTPDAPELDLVDFKILDEGEITLPMFLDALERGETGGRFSAEGDKPDVTATPVPRFDLLQLEAYDSMSVQFSRGCPFNCEFCDIIVLYGRKPRTKTPSSWWQNCSICTTWAGGARSFWWTTTSSATSATPSCCCPRSAPGRRSVGTPSASPPKPPWIWPTTRR